MLEALTEKISGVFSKLGLKKRLTEENIEEGIREIRLALIDADVSLSVIKEFVSSVKKRAVGGDILKNISPVQMFIKIVHDELVAALGSENAPLNLLEPTRTSRVLLCGLQGSGKTTTAGKLALRLKGKREALLVSLDIHRPAANEQLKILATQVKASFYDRGSETDAAKIIAGAVAQAKKDVCNLIIFDTAGRTQVDAEMMQELSRTAKLVSPDETLLVCDSMLGQKAVQVAAEFKAAVKIDGLIFTKFDSDTRGGAVLSVRQVTGAPVKFVGVGEHLTDLDEFVPSRIADRLLGMGDIVGLVQKAQEAVDEEKAAEIARKLEKNEFDYEVFLSQLEQMKKLGSMESILGMIPGLGAKMKDIKTDPKEFIRMEALIRSMTAAERRNPLLLQNNSRKQRVALGSGSTILAVNQLAKKFEEMKKMFRQMNSPSKMRQMLGRLTGSEIDPAEFEKLANQKF